MKHPRVLFLILFSAAFCCNKAQAQTTLNVCHAQVFFADTNAVGKVVTSGNALVFIDDQPISGWLSPQPVGTSEGFSIDKSNVTDVNLQPGTISIYTRRMVRYRTKAEKHITFRFISGNCNAIAEWLKARSPKSPSVPGKKQIPPLIFPAKLRRSMRPDISGDLIIAENMITFGNRRGSTYRWDFRDIKDIRLISPRVLEIAPFAGSKFTFDLLGRSIYPQEFGALRARIMRQ